MKKFYTIYLLSFSMLFFSCSDSTEDEFEEVNEDAAELYLEKIVIELPNNEGTETVNINYDQDGKVSSGNNSDGAVFLNYQESGDLNSYTDNNETISMSEFYQAPYDAFEVGQILSYYDNGNVENIEVIDDTSYPEQTLYGTITYDTNPSAYFYTLKAAGILDVLDSVDLNFGLQAEEIIKARNFLPYNNITSMIFENAEGLTQYEVHIDYTYNSDNYPIAAIITATSTESTDVTEITYTYR